MSDHPHRWRIETPNGPTCAAVCLVCGAERTYRTAESEMSAKEILHAGAAGHHRGKRKAVTGGR